MKKALLIFALLLASSVISAKAEDGTALALAFRMEVDRRLELPQPDQLRYAQLLEGALAATAIPFMRSQYILVLDRNPNVQAIFVYWLDAQAATDHLRFIGASPASTGKSGRRGSFITPLGVFAHTLDNKDFRAEGTLNKLGIRGYGRKGMRVFDFGWVQAERGWGSGGQYPMRFLLHATDPDFLEQYMGVAKSKGCIRIPATLNTFIDRYGLLDDDYEQALASGKKIWVLRPDRTPTPWSGRYLVIVDSGSTERPAWSPEPDAKGVPKLEKLH
jgi:hypothetical protein